MALRCFSAVKPLITMFREFRLIIIPLALFLKAVISPPLPVIAGSLAMPRDMLFGRSG
ncbi:MAG: hypothetical protein NTW75_09520 [Planctomycetales bacterium]|nr:hypothetical protein [Planctomycetales bacterium]